MDPAETVTMTTLVTWSDDVNATTTMGPVGRTANFYPIRLGYFIGIGVLIPIGFIFNTLAIVVLVGSRSLRNSTTGIYLISLSVADTLFLIGELLRWLDTDHRIPGYTFLRMSDASCQFVFCLRYGSKLSSAWITVVIVVERFFIVRFPLRALVTCTKRLAAGAIGVVYGVCFLLGCFPVFSIGLEMWAGQFECFISDHDWYEIGSWVVLRVGSLLLPGIIVIVFTVLIVINLSRASALRRRTLTEDQVISRSADPRGTRGAMERQLTAMLLAVAIAFIVLRLPYTILFYINEYKSKIWVPLDKYFSFQIYVATKIADLFAATNYVVNFFLYCLTGSTFRSQLRLLFRCNKNDNRGRRKLSTSTATINSVLSSEKMTKSALKRLQRNVEPKIGEADHGTNPGGCDGAEAPPAAENVNMEQRNVDFSDIGR